MSVSDASRRLADPIRAAIAANKSLFVVVFAFSAVLSLLALTVSFYMLEVYDRVLASRSEETLLLLTAIAVASLAVFGVLDALRQRLLMRASMRVADLLSARVLRAMVAISAVAGTPSRQGLRDVETVRNFIGSPAFATWFDAPFLLFFLIVLYLLHPAFFAIVCIGGVLLVAIAVANQILTAGRLYRSIGASIAAHGFAENGVRNADLLEGMGMSATFIARWRRQWLESLRLGLEASDRDTALLGISKAVRQVIQVALLGTGALLVLDFRASGGVMIAASILGSRALAPVEAVVGSWKSIVAVRLARGRLTRLLAEAPLRDEGMELPAPRGQLQAQRASYVAPRTRKPILNNISFDLPAGETLGIIGATGSGKSTLLRLLIGAWPCTAGVVRLDGADIYAWPRQSLSFSIGYLPQDVELFAGTVRDNIARLGDGDPDAVVAAAKLANADEMIRALPKGYDTDIGEDGHALSGGQRQRIGIARALFGAPRFVALDEPNASLDGPGEEALKLTLAELKRRGVTVAIVAHRPSILVTADKILALRDGTVENFGPRGDMTQRYAEQAAGRGAPANVVALSSALPQPRGADPAGGAP